MHELGIIIKVVEQIEEFAKKNRLTKIDSLTLEVGELSGIVPKYIEDVYPIAIEKTLLENTKLVIIEISGNGLCNECHQVYNVMKHNRTCPKCQSQNTKIISGTEFNIKDITAC